MRKTLWAIAAIAALLLIWLYVDWRRSVLAMPDVSALTSEINKTSDDIDKAVAAELPADAGLNELSQYRARFAALNNRTDELMPLVRDNLFRAKGDDGTRFRRAVSNYTKKVQLIGPKLNEVQKRIDEIVAKQS
jgi:hypothetical protein